MKCHGLAEEGDREDTERRCMVEASGSGWSMAMAMTAHSPQKKMLTSECCQVYSQEDAPNGSHHQVVASKPSVHETEFSMLSIW